VVVEHIDLAEHCFKADIWLTVFVQKRDLGGVDFGQLDVDLNKGAEREILSRVMPLGSRRPISNTLGEPEVMEDPVYEQNADVIWSIFHIRATLSEEFELERYPVDLQFLKIFLGLRKEVWEPLRVAPPWLPRNMRSQLWIEHRLPSNSCSHRGDCKCEYVEVPAEDIFKVPVIYQATANVNTEYELHPPWVAYGNKPQAMIWYAAEPAPCPSLP
jgi:hypothetical protein